MAITTIGLDLVKPEFPIVGYNELFKEVKRRTLRRHEILQFFRRLSPCLVGIEQCSGAHYWGRQFQDLGHNVKVVPTHYIKMELNNPNKGFFNDARVIAAATIRTNIPEVPIKSVEQLEANSIYRMYTQCLRDRNSVCNLTWQMLTEQGVNIPKGVTAMRRFLPCLLEDSANGFGDRLRRILENRLKLLIEMDDHLNFYESEISSSHH